MNTTKEIVYWEGPGWYASRQDADGNQTTYRFGSDPKREPDAHTLEGYGSATWYNAPPSWATDIR